MLLGSPVVLEHLEEYLCENVQKSVDGTVGLQVENHLLNSKIYTDFRVSCIWIHTCLALCRICGYI